ncbi:MAG: tetratricopeptide repeat protein [Oligoflexia bacterium]|nr:tetratricopeptide repeat protein [Oligoflexia bacterium]
MIGAKQKSSPLLIKYLNEYQKNPHSIVFAPLAENYRKLGLVNEALKILKKGIKFHPSYLTGHLSLAFCYFDLQKFESAYEVLKPFVKKNIENQMLQKLFAEVCRKLGHNQEALQAYQNVLFINSRDQTSINAVEELTEILDEQGSDDNTDEINPIPSVAPLPLSVRVAEQIKQWDNSGWSYAQLGSVVLAPAGIKEDTLSSVGMGASTEMSAWNKLATFENSAPASASPFPPSPSELSSEPPPGDSFGILQEAESREGGGQKKNDLLTFTLADLYCSQGHYDKAAEVLDKLYILNPQSERIKNKIQELKATIFNKIKDSPPSFQPSRDHAVDDIANCPEIKYDVGSERSKQDAAKIELLRKKYSKFLEKIRGRVRGQECKELSL